MKKLIALVLALVLVLGMTACSVSGGKNVEIKVVLSAQPETQVIVSAKSSDISELQIINQATMIFTEENWNVPQTVILTCRIFRSITRSFRATRCFQTASDARILWAATGLRFANRLKRFSVFRPKPLFTPATAQARR